MRKVPIASSIQPLPSNFADQVLRLEISVEVESSMDSLRSLLELYSVILTQQAIEYYESFRDPKYKYYQERMMELLQRQNTLLLASADPPRPRPSLSVSHDLLQKREADKAIKLYEAASQSVSRQVSMNLQSQNSSIVSRFNNRKSRNVSAEPKPPQKFGKIFGGGHHKRRSSEGESDRSGGGQNSKEAEQFEKELEEIMEASVMEKIEKTHEIKRKYRKQIEEIKQMKGNSLMDQLVKELERGMDEEMAALEIVLEEKRKIAIKKIKDFLVTR